MLFTGKLKASSHASDVDHQVVVSQNERTGTITGGGTNERASGSMGFWSSFTLNFVLLSGYFFEACTFVLRVVETRGRRSYTHIP